MIKFEKCTVTGFDAAIRGMRNPMNSWTNSDSGYCEKEDCLDCKRFETGECDRSRNRAFIFGPKDFDLAMSLARAGSSHAKFRRMINVHVDIVAPLYWWKEFDQYKVGTTTNSTSTMHKIHDKEFELDDFSHEHLIFKDPVRPLSTDDVNWEGWTLVKEFDGNQFYQSPLFFLKGIIDSLNTNREAFLRTKDKRYWWQMIQLLPSSYNYRKTVGMNYEVLAGIYEQRRNHKLDEWVEFCSWIKSLPYANLAMYKDGKRYFERRKL